MKSGQSLSPPNKTGSKHMEITSHSPAESPSATRPSRTVRMRLRGRWCVVAPRRPAGPLSVRGTLATVHAPDACGASGARGAGSGGEARGLKSTASVSEASIAAASAETRV